MTKRWVREWDQNKQQFIVSDCYKVSEDGSLYSYRRKKVRQIGQRKNSSGNLVVMMEGKTKQVHRLVAYTFVRNRHPKFYTKVIHLNKNKEDNRKENLMWVSPVEFFRWRNNVLARTRVRKRA